MFLLNPVVPSLSPADGWSFTSHYVPIKSRVYAISEMMQGDLHPIMFLLNPRAPTTSIAVPTFTSHYVPIKSYVPVCFVRPYPLIYIPLCSY